MTTKQTPLVDLLRLHAEDLHSGCGHNQSSRLLSQAADEIERLHAELAAAKRENDVLRGKLAMSELPCVYCGLDKGDWEKCPHGFPGCGRADDALLLETDEDLAQE